MIEPRYETLEVNKAPVVKRISWGAVVAGVVVALVTQLLLSVLGFGIGVSTIDPVTEQNPVAGIGVGMGIWFVLSTLLSLFAGGWVAGRLAGIPRKTDSALHGVLTWGSATLVTFFLLTTAVGALLSGAAGVLGKGLSLAGQGVSAAVPEVADAVQSNVNVDVSAIKEEAIQLLRQTDKPSLQPIELAAQADNAEDSVTKSAMQAAEYPQSAEDELAGIVDRITSKGENIVEAADREALVNVLVARTDMSQEEASAAVSRWEETYQRLRSEYQQAKVALEENAREIAGATAHAVSAAALWTFVIFLLGGAAAAAGGLISAPPEITESRRETWPVDRKMAYQP